MKQLGLRQTKKSKKQLHNISHEKAKAQGPQKKHKLEYTKTQSAGPRSKTERDTKRKRHLQKISHEAKAQAHTKTQTGVDKIAKCRA